MYAEHFKLHKNIFFNHEVVQVCKSEDHARTGRWRVRYAVDGNETEEIFDGVMICNGHHVFPRSVKFPGQEKFKGGGNLPKFI